MVNEFAALVKKVTSQTPQSASSVNKSEAHQKKNNNGDEAQFWIYLADERNNTTTLMMAKLDLYLQEATINKEESFYLLNLWRVNELQFPILTNFATQILATLVTSIALESSFSMSGSVMIRL